jgi:UDP-glucose 4-epimerase
MIADMLLAAAAPARPVVRKVLASQQGTTIASLLSLCRHVFKRPPQLVLGSSASARFQVRDLRLRSVCWPEIDQRVLTPLPAGLAATAAGMLRAAQRSGW